MRKLISFVFCCLIAIGYAQETVKTGDRLDIVLKDGTRHEASKITDISAEQIMFINKKGVFSVWKSNLDASSQAKFGWSDAVGNKIEEEKAKAEKAQQATQVVEELTIKANLNIIQVLPDGILARGSGYYGTPTEETQKIPAKYETKTETFTEIVPSLNGPTTVVRTRSYKVLTEPDKTITNTKIKPYPFEELFFVEMNTEGLVDEGSWAGLVWEAGTYSYTAVNNSRKTVRKYTAFPPENIRKLMNAAK